MKPNYDRKHWNHFERKSWDIKAISRKTKKAVKKEIEVIELEHQEYLKSDDYKFTQLPDCVWCGGGGVYRDHPMDTGYGCPDCYGSGKTGWEFDENRKPVIKEANQ